MSESNYTQELRSSILDDFDEINRLLSLFKGISSALELGTENNSIGQPAAFVGDSISITVDLVQTRLLSLQRKLLT